MRIDQYGGLNSWARKTVLKKEKARITGVMEFTDGRRKRFTRWASVPVARVEVIGVIRGKWVPRIGDLHRYTLPGGKVYEEFVQEDVWHGGPIWITALKDVTTGEPVAESIWSKEEMARLSQ